MAKIVTYTCTHTKRSVNQPRRGWYEHPRRGCSLRSVNQPLWGLVYEPGSRRLTVRLRKEKATATNPFGVGMSTPVGGAHMCIGGPHRGLPYAHHPKGVVKT